MENTSIIRQAANLYKKGDFEVAMKLYQKAAQIIGEDKVNANIFLCQKRIHSKGSAGLDNKVLFVSNTEVEALRKENQQLKMQIMEKENNINERFRELAILTAMLEEMKNNGNS